MTANSVSHLLDLVRLPKGVDWYEVQGRRIFPIFDSVGPTSKLCAYLVKAFEGKYLFSALEFNVILYSEMDFVALALQNKIEKAIEHFVEVKEGDVLPRETV
jgi:hypothetical protein